MAKRNFAKRDVSEYNTFRAIFQYVIVYFLFLPYFKIFYNLKIEGKENIPKNESFIIAGTHSSYFDPLVLAVAASRPIAYMAKKELFEVPIISTLIDILGAFAVNRENLEIATIRTAKTVIGTKNWIMALFPQGNRDLPYKITKVSPGFAYLAKSTKAKILPASITGSHEYKFIPFTGNITVKLGKLMDCPTDMEAAMEEWGNRIEEIGDYEFTQEAKDKIRQKAEV